MLTYSAKVRTLTHKLTPPLGIFGGTFDPVHLGHLRLAEEAREHLGLGQICWIPAGQPPHRGQPQVTAENRLQMVQLATAGNPHFVVDPAEVEAQQPSYTVLTLERLRQVHGATRPLVLLLGADAFAGLLAWHRWQEVLQFAHLAIAHRPGFPVQIDSLSPVLAALYQQRFVADPRDLQTTPAGKIACFAMTQLAISATQIRKLLAQAASARYLLPDSVLDYIRQHSLYRKSE